MLSLFAEMDFFDDLDPHDAALNMAIDEVLLADLARPLLRVYRWDRPAVSLGYFEKWEPVRRAHPDRALVRRWTGGGVVPHENDFTYSVLVPARCEFAKIDPMKTYRMIHEAIADLLRGFGFAPILASDAQKKRSSACFENAVACDILLNGQKIAGAAQRRTNSGLLHQGSVQLSARDADWAPKFAGLLTPQMFPFCFRLWQQAQALAAAKYATDEWTQKF